jgi:hypothetical protein
MTRLTAAYGKSVYSEERAKLIWRAVESLSSAWWEKTVDEFIAYCRQAPLMDQIREKVSEERERIWGRQKHQMPKLWELPRDARCFACKDSGVVMARAKDGTPGFYTFKCGCPVGQSDRRAYPRWGHEWEESYEGIA